MRKTLAKRADVLEQEIVDAVAGGAETLRDVWPHLKLDPGEATLARYAFFHALNEERIVMSADRRLRIAQSEDS